MASRADPTLAQLRATVQKRRHREIGNVLARYWARPTAIHGTWLALRLGLSAHQVTCLAWACSLASAGLIASGARWGFLVGVALAWLAFWLDRVDGQVARWRGTSSLDGVYLDYLMHHVASLALGFALGQGLAVRGDDPRWSLAGCAIACGWALLALHNDCRYKALFQRLKRDEAVFLVECGSGGRPTPPAPWPRRGLGMVTWPLFKICEHHVVLMGMGLLALSAIASPRAWAWGWKVATISLALIAPALAAARVVRAVRRGSVEAEFARWFQPVEGCPEALDDRPRSAVR